jgi:hypothetical protein
MFFVFISVNKPINITKTIFMRVLKFNAIAALSMAFLSFTACSEDEEVKKSSKVLFVHASPDAPAVDIDVAGGSAAKGAAFGANTNYATFSVNETDKFKTDIKVASSGAVALSIADPAWTNNMNYSVFVIDSVKKLKAVSVMDMYTVPTDGKALVRFVHASPNAPNVDVKAGTASLFTNIPFLGKGAAGATSFIPVAAGTVTLDVFITGGDKVLSAPVTLAANKVYTVWAKGFAGGTGAQALGAGIVTHN